MTLLLTGAGTCSHAAADPAIAQRNDRVAYLVHLMDHQRYAEAAQGVQQLFIDYPTDAGAYEVRGVLQLHVGAFQQAQRDFEYARSMADASDPLPAYGLALCGITARNTELADKMLTNAEAIATPKQRDDITIARAILASAKGDSSEAVRLANTVDSPVAREITALAVYSKSPAVGLPLVEKFVSDAVVGDLPRVTEDTGLRYVGPGSRSGSVIEPSLTESVLQGMFAQRLAYQNAPLAAGSDNVVMGVTAVGPTGNLSAQIGQSDLVITTSVDDHLLGMANSQPFQISWDTRKVGNGIHLLKFEISDSHGAVLQTQYRKVKVTNPGNDLAEPSAPFPADVIDGLWSLLTIHPAYKAAEYTLAQAYIEHKDRSRAASHLLVTAALDSEYRGVGDMVGQVFHNVGSDSFQLATASYNPPIKSSAVHPGEMWSGSNKVREVALTFDDGPSPQVTPTLLDNLKKAGVHGTFFVVGIRATAAPDLLRRMQAEGHEVENHTYTHPNLDQALPQHILEEYLRNGVVIRALTGRWPRFLRPPGGNSNPQVMEIAHKCGMIGGFWTIDALRAEDTGSSQEVASYVVAKARPGAIILMHNGSDATAGAVQAMVAGLKARGLKCVTLSELAKHSGIELQ
ncbi:MAG: polysaccharide deacetylase family protein [Capsulimonadaceae bacterium]|nr:polysaccharide deacetylase family protein [Capsulimonadaceae bacterium]